MIMGFIVLVSLVLAGCTLGSSIEQQLADAMTAMNSAEKNYREAQSELTDLENLEQQLFNETMKLTQQQQEELTTKVAELEALLDKRLGKLEQEEVSMVKAKAFARDLDAIIEKAEEPVKAGVEGLKNKVNERYVQHAEFITAYKKLAALQKELYEMLRVEKIQLVELKDQVNDVNAQNEIVQSAVTSFNELTEEVNVQKDDVFAKFQKEK
ncbi:YkyA family protein [Sporosarcina sp. YIM B06819]|uniref:YkyA family protein n=1 Tax=Sporosarcina sp. YIM B06819 TaxID=3081769 RepID=UPI00298C9EE8|nr:YkyA family protein [Sporosarcina sp. YIM B06819]